MGVGVLYEARLPLEASRAAAVGFFFHLAADKAIRHNAMCDNTMPRASNDT